MQECKLDSTGSCHTDGVATLSEPGKVGAGPMGQARGWEPLARVQHPQCAGMCIVWLFLKKQEPALLSQRQ